MKKLIQKIYPKTWKLKFKKELRFPASFYGIGYYISKKTIDE